jgi:hypothetical protein
VGLRLLEVRQERHGVHVEEGVLVVELLGLGGEVVEDGQERGGDLLTESDGFLNLVSPVLVRRRVEGG